MTILKLILAIVEFALGLMKMVERERLVTEGELSGATETMELTREKLNRAIAAREAAAASPLDADADGVPDSDGYRRD